MNRLSYLMAASLFAVTAAGCGDDSSSLECGANTTDVDGICVADVVDTITCGTGTVASGTECVPDGSVICETGTTFDMASGTCVADITGCGAGTVVVDGECRDPGDITTDLTEPAEPNDLGPDGTPGTFDLPAVGSAITISGCIEPTVVEGETIADFDAFVFMNTGTALLDITVDGLGGAAGAFQLETGDQELVAAGFNRFGINLAGDMSQREVFLPKTATYAISFGDSRSFFLAPAGGPDACYVATIRNLAIPAATAVTPGTALDGTFSNKAQFLSLTPAADGTVARSETDAPSNAALIDSILLVNDTYQSSSAGLGGRDFGDSAGNVAGGLNTADTVVYVIDPVINFALSPVGFSHLVTDVPVVSIATDGSSVSVPSPNNDGGSLLSFNVANAGDVVFLDLDATGFTDIDWFVLNSSLQPVATIATFSGGQQAGHYRFASAGVHYIEIQDFGDSTVDPYNVVSTQIDHTPTALSVGTPVTAQTFGADNAAFYSITPAAFEWWNLTGTPTAFDADMLLSVFDASDSGQLFRDMPELANFVLVDGVDNLQVIEDAPPVLFMISDDSATPNPAATFDFSIADHVFTDLGPVTAAAPVNSVVTSAGADTYYIASANVGETINLTVTGNNGLDPILVVIDGGGETVIDNNAGADSDEQNLTFVANGTIAFAIRDVGGVGGDYTLDLSIVASQNLTSAPGVAIPDNDPAGVEDTITATACTIVSLDFDVDISHTFISDLLVTVTSPTGTEVTLHDRSGGGAVDIVGNYNGTLVSSDDLTILNGEEALGDWIIAIDDDAGGDAGTLNSWGINLGCL